MGYFGRILVGQGIEPVPGVTVLDERELGGGWRWWQCDGDLPGGLDALVGRSGAPALWAYIVDSDLADVEALTPSGLRFRTYLHPEMAESYDAPPLAQSPEEVLDLARRWAAEAGLTPDDVALRSVLEAENTFAEATLGELVVALGI
ncbi:hypothetical protein [Actinoplanes sp. NPDC049265]|uniref:hypothetical protein n=1 Tax=Actinoplanes sp. NPDC049265 TaxID=3363902 RepID=UPI00370FF6D8